MSGILVVKYASGRNVKQCFIVRGFGRMHFMKSNRNVYTVRNYLVLKIKLCNFLLLKMAKRKCKVTDEMTAIHPIQYVSGKVKMNGKQNA